MEAFRMKPGNSSDDHVAADEKRVQRATGRRKQDTVISMNPDQKVNMDRRALNSDRRIKDDPNYNGPSRRYTIDRRLSLKDRRSKE